MAVTEMGLATLDLTDYTVHKPADAWRLAFDDPAQDAYFDSLRETIQHWAGEEVSGFIRDYRHTMARIPHVLTADGKRHVMTQDGQPIARFRLPTDAAIWLAMMTGEAAAVTTTMSQHLATPLATHHDRWWLPGELRAHPFPHIMCPRHVPDGPPCVWTEVYDTAAADDVPVAEFRLPGMALAFAACQLYRLTNTCLELTPGMPVQVNHGEVAHRATLQSMPHADLLVSRSTVTVAIDDREPAILHAHVNELRWPVPGSFGATPRPIPTA